MKVIDPGHCYRLFQLDGTCAHSVLQFVKRQGDGYPGNEDSYPGTNCQDVLRVLIDRTQFLDKQVPCPENKQIVEHLRQALSLFEVRAAHRHRRGITLSETPELMEFDKKDGHIKNELEGRNG